MCGRYTLTSQEGLVEEMQLAIAEPSEPPRVTDPLGAGLVPAPSEWWRPRFNVAPTQPAPIVPNRDGPRHIELARWGLLPPWSKTLSEGAKKINARSETAASSPAFKDALAKRRCLVPADGFFEWRKDGKIRTPFWIHRSPRHPIAFAGIWERWKSPDGIWVISFSILTTDANALVAPLHDRMPVVLPHDAYDRWLDPAALDPRALADLLVPAPTDGWSVDEVTTKINKPDFDEPFA